MSNENAQGRCPNCGGGDIVEGRLLDLVGVGGGTAFRPKGRGLLAWFFRRDANVSNPVFACAKCGLLWTFVDPRRLR